MSDWITTQEASELLGVSIRTIQRYVKAGKLRAKVVSGRASVKKEAIEKIKGSENGLQAVESEQGAQKAELGVPEGYIMIDRETLESLRKQIETLTESVSQMQLTQKMLIEKGLNLKKEIEAPREVEPAPAALSPLDHEHTSAPALDAKITTPINEVAKVHEEFFGKNKNQNRNTILWIALGVIFVIIIVIAYNALKVPAY